MRLLRERACRFGETSAARLHAPPAVIGVVGELGTGKTRRDPAIWPLGLERKLRTAPRAHRLRARQIIPSRFTTPVYQ